jgi:hypothetical protein
MAVRLKLVTISTPNELIWKMRSLPKFAGFPKISFFEAVLRVCFLAVIFRWVDLPVAGRFRVGCYVPNERYGIVMHPNERGLKLCRLKHPELGESRKRKMSVVVPPPW